MEEKELNTGTQEQAAEQIDPQQNEIAESPDASEETKAEEQNVESADIAETNESGQEAAVETTAATAEESEAEKSPVVEEDRSPALMPEELIKKLQTEPTHRKRGMGRKKVMQGVVESNKGDKTIIVKIERQVAHPLYKKYYKSSKKIMAHDETNDCNIGDIVKVKECRPLSARKRWTLTEVISRAK